MDTFRKQEILLYVILWSIFILAISMPSLVDVIYGRAGFDSVWPGILSILPFLVLFVLHDQLATIFLRRDNKTAYILLSLLLVSLFGLYCFRWGNMVSGMPSPPGPPPGSLGPDGPGPDGGRMPGGPPFRPEAFKFMVGILILGVGLGIKAYYSLRKKEADYALLQQENLRTRLEALRRQINPHFLMNTLNNIQVLTLTEPEKATKSIQDLSRLLHVVIYEGEENVIPIADEISFLQNFISLMKLRYTENIEITTDFPESAADAFIPPMVMGTFVENAFKHGVSHDAPSYVHVSLEVADGKVICRCKNSRHAGSVSDQKGGIGLDNIRTRLDLIYGSDYSLVFDEQPDSFEVLLVIPSNIDREQI